MNNKGFKIFMVLLMLMAVFITGCSKKANKEHSLDTTLKIDSVQNFKFRNTLYQVLQNNKWSHDNLYTNYLAYRYDSSGEFQEFKLEVTRPAADAKEVLIIEKNEKGELVSRVEKRKGKFNEQNYAPAVTFLKSLDDFRIDGLSEGLKEPIQAELIIEQGEVNFRDGEKYQTFLIFQGTKTETDGRKLGLSGRIVKLVLDASANVKRLYFFPEYK